jgi:hypothetical protein
MRYPERPTGPSLFTRLFRAGKESAVELSRRFGLERGNFQSKLFLALCLAWVISSFFTLITVNLQRGYHLAASPFIAWAVGKAFDLLGIFLGLRFFRRAFWAGLVTGACTFPMMIGAHVWSVPYLIFNLTYMAYFIWVLAWIARKTDFNWKLLFAGTFAAFFLCQLTYMLALIVESEGWNPSLLNSMQPLADFVHAAFFAAIFAPLSAKWAKRA